MKKLSALLFALVCVLPAAATDMGDDFRNHISASSDLSAYNKDVATMIGVADFHTAKGATFPGFDIGASVSAIKPSDSNHISHEDYLYTGFLTAETKLPVVGITVMARGTDMNGFKSLGGGLKYSFKLLEVIDVSTMAFYDRGSTDWYKQDHYSASATASFTFLFLTPYAGVGYDYAKMETKNLPYRLSSDDDSVRYTVGASLKPFPFGYLFGAYTKTAGNEGFQGGIGLNF